MKLNRTFHPVGQGAFYTEVFEHNDGKNSVVVYDCGTISKADDFNQCGGQSFYARIDDFKNGLSMGPQIDILFISHLHLDHINGILRLIKGVKVEKLVLPMLPPDVILVSRVSNFITLKDNAGDEERNAIRAVDDFIQYLCVENHDKDTDDDGIQSDDREPIIHQKIEKLYVKTADVLTLIQNNSPFWRYRVFNSIEESDDRSHSLVLQLAEKGYIRENKSLNVEEILDHLEDVRKIYKGVMGTTNDNYYTLVVESEPIDSKSINQQPHKLGCVYFGDFVPQKKLLERFFNTFDDYCSEIGTIQLPHHGSKANWDSKIIRNTVIHDCIISVGLNNGFHHPSFYVIGDIQNNNAKAHTVYENPKSKVELEFFI